MDFDPQPWRDETPAALAGRIHLNNAGAALMPARVHTAVISYLESESKMGGYEAADAFAVEIAAAYDAVADLIGARAHNIAIVENATVAAGLALTAFDFEPGDVLLTTRNDYISNQLMYLALAERQGIRVVRAEDLPEGGVDPDSVRSLIAELRPRLVSLSWVPTNSGLVQPAAEVGRICAEAGVPYLVDACQAVGQIPIDVTELHCDYLAATARKFLRGPRGIGFLFVGDTALEAGSHPLYIDMRGATWTADDRYEPVAGARRFENWEFNYASVIGLGEAARYATRIDITEAGRYAGVLAQRVREAFMDAPGARVLDRGSHLCAIASVEFVGHDPNQIVAQLREQAINTAASFDAYARLDMRDKQARTAVRISPHYYNTEREIRIAVGALEEFCEPR